MDFRVEYELRRKIGNIIGIEIVKLVEKIDNIEKTTYLLVLSIEDIEKKLSKQIKKTK